MTRFITSVLLALFACGAHSQSSDKRLEFDVASVKLAQPGQGRMGFRGGPGTGDPTRLVIDNHPLHTLIMRAYDLSPFQISGLNYDGDRYDITAKVPEGTTKEQFRAMLQNLLADRLQLKVRREIKELPIYEMTVAKTGVKFKEHQGDLPKEQLDLPSSPVLPRDKNGVPMAPPNTLLTLVPQGGGAQGRFNAVNEPMADFVKVLSRQFGRSVVDSTGLKGKYDFLLVYSMELAANMAASMAARVGAPGAAPSPAAPTASAPEPDLGPNLIGALQELGFKLDSKKGPVELLVVDHFEKVPTEN
jgi:uncharacterized protein (TIGR03435 family)